MRNVVFLAVSFFILFKAENIKAQEYYWIAFTDKNNTEYSTSNPEEYLSERAIERRIKQNIPIDSLDLPVNSTYIDSIICIGAELVHSSKWMNGITVKTDLDNFANILSEISFVKEVQLTKPAQHTKSAINKFYEAGQKVSEPIDTSKYGASVYQTGLMNGQFLHNQNYNGQGIQIAVLDGGFTNVDEYIAFDSIWANNQILGTKDFVDSDSDIFDTHYHGTSVLSCIAGNVPGELFGTATKASFWLLRSEDGDSEYLIEEDNWIAAAEFADSVGVDIINSSLGYSEFDDTTMNHTYADMDGKTTRVTKGANIAASRGILVFSSAGNEGNDDWKYIIAPSDGDKVISVGASNKYGFAAYFTSYGPASDGDIKPNVTGVGWNTYLQRGDGELGYSNGTSFSSPVIAGMAACLWQAVPYSTATEVKQAIEMSASLYNEPDSLLGYGIPDFQIAFMYLFNQTVQFQETEDKWLVYPNPLRNFLILQQKDVNMGEDVEIEIYSIEGKLIRQWNKPNSSRILLAGLQSLPNGLLVMKVTSDNYSETIKLYKQR